ncbi:hypothetical protein JCM14720_01240 [Calditerricola yamamurae]
MAPTNRIRRDVPCTETTKGEAGVALLVVLVLLGTTVLAAVAALDGVLTALHTQANVLGAWRARYAAESGVAYVQMAVRAAPDALAFPVTRAVGDGQVTVWRLEEDDTTLHVRAEASVPPHFRHGVTCRLRKADGAVLSWEE